MIEIKILVKDVDYSNIVDKALPIALEQLSKKKESSILLDTLTKFKGFSGIMLKAALSVLPQELKDEIAVHYLSSYKNDIIGFTNKMAAEKGFKIEIENVEIKNLGNENRSAAEAIPQDS